MKILIKYIVSLLAFWLLVFLTNRIFFILYQLPIGERIKLNSDLALSFVAGHQLDFATASMFMMPVILFVSLFYIFKIEFLHSVIKFWIGLVLTIYIITSLSDSGLYREWNAKLNMQALEHFKNPSEVFQIISPKLMLFFVTLILLFTFPFYYLYKRKIHPQLLSLDNEKISKRVLKSSAFFVVGVFGAILFIRGGLLGMPINQSVAYFSNDVLANDIAVNPFYNILQDFSIKNNIPDSSVYKFRTNEEAKSIIANDFEIKKDTTIQILKNNRPNIVIIFLESWSADNIQCLDGIEGCTPQFDKLAKEGLLFTQAYSNAYVSDQGIPAVMSGYPSVSRVAIINQPAKVPLLPTITEELKTLEYNTSFLFGGELVYGNIRGYLLEKQFDEMKEVFQIPQYPTGRLGVHDEYTFKELGDMLIKKKEPFLQGYFTQSTHMPYDFIPSDNWKSESNDPEKLYTESVHYSDIHLGKFFDRMKKEKIYENTLFIVVADHSHNSIKQRDPGFPTRHRIPLLFLGGALRDEWKGKNWTRIVSQLDVPATLFAQMDIKSNRYPWSRNIFNPYTPSSAYYVFYGGMGYICDSGFASSHQENPFNISTESNDSVTTKTWLNKALSFQQLVYEDLKNRK